MADTFCCQGCMKHRKMPPHHLKPSGKPICVVCFENYSKKLPRGEGSRLNRGKEVARGYAKPGIDDFLSGEKHENG